MGLARVRDLNPGLLQYGVDLDHATLRCQGMEKVVNGNVGTESFQGTGSENADISLLALKNI